VAQQPEFHTRFTAAGSAVRRLEHPNILSVHELDVVDGNYLLSMEYVPGEKVTSILTRCNTGSPVPPDIAALIVKQAANAAQYVRTVSAVAGRPLAPGPGELDPANLFVTYHGTVKWLAIDLQPRPEVGPASSGEHALSWSRTAESAAAGNADVFSLGALLWTFLTGHRPQLTPAAAEPAAALGGGVPPSSIQPAVPEALDAIVLRALSPQPGQRFASPGELSEALDRYVLQRGARPTHKHIRRWMEQLFEPERAALQLQIARGREVAAALAALANLHGVDSPAIPHSSRRARELWSTRHSIFARPSRPSLEPAPRSLLHDPLPVSERELREAPVTYRAVTPPVAPASTLALAQAQPRPRLWLLAGVLAGVSSLAGASALLLSSAGGQPPQPSTAPAGRSQLDVRSTPEGAAVFVDGEPTGLRTPVVLKGLAGGRTLRLRVEKAGFKSQERELALVAGEAASQAFELVAADGSVHFAGVAPGARLFVDDSLVPADGKPVSLTVGQHVVRVETQSALVFAGTVTVVAGEQTIRVDGVAPPR
jgi:hypothetical protein